MSLEELGLASAKKIPAFNSATSFNPLESYDLSTSRARKEPDLQFTLAV